VVLRVALVLAALLLPLAWRRVVEEWLEADVAKARRQTPLSRDALVNLELVRKAGGGLASFAFSRWMERHAETVVNS